MLALRTPRPDPLRTKSASFAFRRALLWPAAAVGVGALLMHNSLTGPSDDLNPPGRPTVAAPAAPATPAPTPRATRTPTPSAAPTTADRALPRSAPKRLTIPEIDVDAPFTKLSIGASGQLDVPPANDDNLVGWFEGGVSPGERGSSIVVGHVDTKTGPAVFAQLGELKRGSLVKITRADGTVARFKVDSIHTYSKAAFPDDRVYADAPSPELRLITCGGDYNHVKKDYEANVVVFAHLDSAGRG